MQNRSVSRGTIICITWLILHVACPPSLSVAYIWTFYRSMHIPTAAPIRRLNPLAVSMRLCAGFTTRSWMNLVIGTPQRLSTLASARRKKSSSMSVTLQIQRGLTLMSFLGGEGAWESWRLHLLRTRVSILLIPFSICVSAFRWFDFASSTGSAAEVWRISKRIYCCRGAVMLRLWNCTRTGTVWRELWAAVG